MKRSRDESIHTQVVFILMSEASMVLETAGSPSSAGSALSLSQLTKRWQS